MFSDKKKTGKEDLCDQSASNGGEDAGPVWHMHNVPDPQPRTAPDILISLYLSLRCEFHAYIYIYILVLGWGSGDVLSTGACLGACAAMLCVP